MTSLRERWAKVASHDRRAYAVVLALAVVAVVPHLGRGVTGFLRLDAFPRDHSGCLSVVSMTVPGPGSRTYYLYVIPNTTTGIAHEHGDPMPRSKFERRGTAYALLAAGAFLLLWKGVVWFERFVRRTAPIQAAITGFGLGLVLGQPPALLAGWITGQIMRGEPAPPWFSGVVSLSTAVHYTVLGLVTATVVAWYLGARNRQAEADLAAAINAARTGDASAPSIRSGSAMSV